MNVCNTTSISSQMPSIERLPHQAQTVTLRGKSCRDGARGPGAPAAASKTRARSFMPRAILPPFSRSVKVAAGSVARDGIALWSRWLGDEGLPARGEGH